MYDSLSQCIQYDFERAVLAQITNIEFVLCGIGKIVERFGLRLIPVPSQDDSAVKSAGLRFLPSIYRFDVEVSYFNWVHPVPLRI